MTGRARAAAGAARDAVVSWWRCTTPRPIAHRIIDWIRLDPQSGLPWRDLHRIEQMRNTHLYQQAVTEAIRREERRHSRWT